MIILLLLQVVTGFYLLHIAGFYIYDLWLLASIIMTAISIATQLLFLIKKSLNDCYHKINLVHIILLISTLFLMVCKPEFD
ncbi:hypothetical protein EF513_03505 [Rickettsiales endosymbiont of Stachyamoeba lipophora]|nr:hypothetical protein EF513_03505 [Rickettsiales endosymbiont of Stachyamoeba lipophora]